MTIKVCGAHGMGICPKCNRCCMDGSQKCICYSDIIHNKSKDEVLAIFSYLEIWLKEKGIERIKRS